jgi:hypothetical protein
VDVMPVNCQIGLSAGLHPAGLPRAKAHGGWKGDRLQEPHLKWNANLRNRHAMPLCPLLSGLADPSP